ncbi:Isoflavone reductase [Glycine max]|uniref:NmrA-like domain-containing protein n=2 Tax=Glycine subgen. Soja TaxID=1462606 RepID=A0A0R0J163_SOYBN|nr:hypothetical protein JHK85_023563 [Glycine max]KAG5027177.1 hypothetical protein JHK86_023091 [Glycine max]KAH1053935.1 hypothetical protein GYH30_022938 [Glycine max]KAH1239400.1 Isoflavone reductase [Glycine max]RZB99619.1 Isoflavone reductase-like A622 [Glycine soja]
MAAKSKILVLGGTSYIGKFIVMASVEAGHSTFALVRESTLSHPQKSKLIQSFKSFGVTLLYGDVNNHESLVKAIKQVDVLIFTLDVDHNRAVEPSASFFDKIVKIKRAIEAEGIPYTYLVKYRMLC